jgi:curli production assembly/transport component CsgG|tara:strand:- start:354 stop:1193 length:840 start_codon:yes stop_codon:yes gene_type:complete
VTSNFNNMELGIPQIAIAMVLMCLLGGCASTKSESVFYGETPYTLETDTIKRLQKIPDLGQDQITIAVYNFPDKTGQRKPNTKFSQISTAVTQGPEVWVINALKAVGGPNPWFIVLEREGLDAIIKERQLIRSTRELYDGESDVKNQLKPLKFAGLIVEGGIVGYDSNITSGGIGARYFGIGASEQYRTDQVTVSIRIVAVQTGEILLTTSATKTIASYSSGGDVFRFLDMSTKALEIETGVATNEPVNYAIRTTIEHAVHNLIYEGIEKGLWQFKIEE